MFIQGHEWSGQHEELALYGEEQLSLMQEGKKLAYVWKQRHS